MILEELEYEEILSLCSTSEQFRVYVKKVMKKKENTERKISQFIYYNVFLISLGIGEGMGYPLTQVFAPEFVEKVYK